MQQINEQLQAEAKREKLRRINDYLFSIGVVSEKEYYAINAELSHTPKK